MKKVMHTEKMFDERGELILGKDEKLVVKTRFQWFVREGHFLGQMVFYADIGVVYGTNRRIVCTDKIDEGKKPRACIEIPLREIASYGRGLLGIKGTIFSSKRRRYSLVLSPYMEGKMFLDKVMCERL